MKIKSLPGFLQLLSFLFLSYTIISCNTPETSLERHRRRIVTTTGFLADAVRNITGDSAEVTALMGPGVDPHLYKASYGDLKKLTSADIIVYNGLHLEGKMGTVFKKLTGHKITIQAANGLKRDEIHRSDFSKENPDPHIWFDVSLWGKAIRYVGEELIKANPENRLLYTKNLNSYLKKLEALHHWTATEIMSIPDERRVLITAHDAFGYFGKAYNIKVLGLQGISTLSDFGLSDISSIVHFITNRKIKSVFVETSVPRKSIDAVVEGCLARRHRVYVGGALYSDALGDEGTTEGTYIGIVQHNVKTIVKGLK